MRLTLLFVHDPGSNPGLEFSLYPQQLLDGLEQDEHESEEELDDVHICGTCKIQFNSIDAFVDHKQTHQRLNKLAPVHPLK